MSGRSNRSTDTHIRARAEPVGLDTTHDCWHGSYIAFSHWREKLAELAGYSIINEGPQTMVDLDWESLPADRYQGLWPETPVDPLLVLIVHSDCDGSIYPEQAGPLADRLEQLLPLIEDDGSWIRPSTEQFINGLLLAARRGEPVRFH